MTQPMGDSHRRFLQTMMTHACIDERKARSLHQHCCEIHKECYNLDKLDEFIAAINSHLQPMFMKIIKGISEDDGAVYFALVNLADTYVTKMSSNYADNELELFLKTVDLIVSSENGMIASTEILNSVDSLKSKKLKKSEAQQLLHRLVLEKWLNEKRGYYTLSTRCSIEMGPYICKVYEDQIKTCCICRNIVLQGLICEELTCGVKIHYPCTARYFRDKVDRRCPACESFWPHEIPEITQPPSPPR